MSYRLKCVKQGLVDVSGLVETRRKVCVLFFEAKRQAKNQKKGKIDV